jgi:phage-related protein
MATFPSITPTYGAQKSSQPAIRTTQFGDGYQQRVTFGLNQNPKQWSLTWNVSETDADTIEAFLDARAADATSFDWTPIDEGTAYKWICLEWSKTIPYVNRATITATFQQVFEP